MTEIDRDGAADWGKNAAMTSTTSGLYVSHRGNFHYVASWEISGPNLRWTAIVRDEMDYSTQRLLVGEAQLDHVETSPGSLVRRQVEDRIDRAPWQS